MAQPRRAGPLEKADESGLREFIAVAAGALVGACIGIVLGLTRLAGVFRVRPVVGVRPGFFIVGALLFGWTVRLRTQSTPRAVTFGLLHASISCGLCWLTFASAGSTIGLLALSATTAWYHATWFRGAFVVALRIGSARASVMAVVLEGAVGFTGFALWRMLQS